MKNYLLLLFFLCFASLHCAYSNEAAPSIEAPLEKYIPMDKSPTVGLITIGGHEQEINQSTWLYVKNALDYYKKHRPDFIILELNTPGGEVFAAQKISDALKEMDTQLNVPVVAFINNWAISAGAMLAYSCRFIAITKDASMGAAEPLTVESGKAEPASEKVNSAIRADFANRASFYGRNPHIAEAMVDKDIILVKRQGKIIKLDLESQMISTGNDPDILIKPKGKLLTLTSEQLMEFGVADIALAPAKLDPLTPEEEAQGKWPAEKNLLFTYPYFNKYSKQLTIDKYLPDWKEQFFAFLSNPIVSSLIFLGLILGFYLELSTPGFGAAGSLALTCLFLILLSSFANEAANWLELIFIVTGLLVILVEIFVLPTFGLLGFLGILLFIIGLFGLMLPGVESFHYDFDTQTLNAAGQAVFERLAWLCGALVVSLISMLLLGQYVTPKLGAFKRFVLVGNEQEGYVAVDKNERNLPSGTKGIALTPLKPSGKIIVNDTIYDAISYGGYIEKDSPIVVNRTEGSSVVVNLLNSDIKKT